MGIREEKPSGIRISRIIISQVIPRELFNAQSYAGVRFRRLGAWVPEGAQLILLEKGKKRKALSMRRECVIGTSCDNCRWIDQPERFPYDRSTQVTDIYC